MYYNRNDDAYRQEEMLLSSYSSSQIKVEEQAEAANEKRLALMEATYKTADNARKLGKFLPEVKNMLVTEAIYKLVKGALPDTISEGLLSTAKNITANFVLEEGADNLLNSFKTKSCFLAEMGSIIESSYESVKEAAKETFADDFTIKNSDIEAFYAKLEQLDYDKMTDSIRQKVAKAEGEFVEANVADRVKMEDYAADTKDKIDAIKAKDDETKDAIKQEFTQMYKEQINSVMNRKKSILECLVMKTGESILKNNEAKKMYTLESGKLNTPAVIDTAEIMYTFLEAVNTAKIKDITPEYLTKVIETI